ncbi:uncharacterized protein LOC135824224 [Sycon ciliatum]|uniref:uncharacterized protein LOC135824224 n=1 Tax=Sycon ciliatum TaxID=27933 RepID=UPI0031F70EC0
MSSLSIFLTNAFGLQSKFGELQHALRQQTVDIAIVTETKLTAEKMSPAETLIPGYCPAVRKDRTAHGGGVAVWLKAGLCFRHLDTVPCHDFEVIWLLIETCDHHKIVFCALYRSGSSSESDISLIEYLEETLLAVRHLGDYVLITGDFNVHNTAWLGSTKTTVAGEALEDLCASHYLTQHVSEPTRKNNTLDLVISDLPGAASVTTGPPLGRSDHVTILTEFKTVRPRKEQPALRIVWQYARADWGRMRAHLSRINWPTVLSNDPDAACEALTGIVRDAMSQFIPSKTIKVMATDPVWWTPACQQAVHLKQQAWRVWRQDPDSLQQKETFLASVTHCVHVLQHAQRQCKERASRKLSSGSLQDKQWWTATKRAAGVSRQSDIPVLVDRSGHEHTTAREKAECFAQYFAMKCSLGSNDFSASDHLPAMQLDATAPQITAIHFRPANVRRQLAALNPHKATGPDGISARVLKECHRELAEPAARLFSCCFRAGVQPASWKLAHVSPIHKKSSK